MSGNNIPLKGGKIFVTGGAGYIGSHINKELNKEGYETVVFDNLVYGHREAVKWGEFMEGDLSDIPVLEKVFEKYATDAIFYFAAFAYVGESVTELEKYYYNNLKSRHFIPRIMSGHIHP